MAGILRVGEEGPDRAGEADRGQIAQGIHRPCCGHGVYSEDNGKSLMCFKQGKQDQFYILVSTL